MNSTLENRPPTYGKPGNRTRGSDTIASTTVSQRVQCGMKRPSGKRKKKRNTDATLRLLKASPNHTKIGAKAPNSSVEPEKVAPSNTNNSATNNAIGSSGLRRNKTAPSTRHPIASTTTSATK